MAFEQVITFSSSGSETEDIKYTRDKDLSLKL